MKFIKKNSYKFLFLAYAIFIPAMIYADTNIVICNPSEGKICNPIHASTISGLIKTILEGLIKLAIPVLALAIIYAGFLFVAARGNPEKLGKAKDALLYTLIGAAIILGSWAIATLISNTVNAL